MAVRDHTAGREARPIFPEGLARSLGVTEVGGALREHVIRRQDQGARFSPGSAQPSPAPQRSDGRDRQRHHDAERQQEQDHLPHRRAPASSGRAGGGKRRQREPVRELPPRQVLQLARKLALIAGRPRRLRGSATGSGGASRGPGGAGDGGVLILVRDGVRPAGCGLEGEPAVRREQHLDPAVELARRDVVHAGVRIPLARGVADRHPRREPQRPEHHGHGARELLAEPPLRGRQELEDRVGVVASRDGLVVDELRRIAQMILDGEDALVVVRGARRPPVGDRADPVDHVGGNTLERRGRDVLGRRGDRHRRELRRGGLRRDGRDVVLLAGVQLTVDRGRSC